jgi:hypothetical protein
LLSSVSVDLMAFVWRLNKPSFRRRHNVVFDMFISIAKSWRVVLLLKSTSVIASASKGNLFRPEFPRLLSSPCRPSVLHFVHQFTNVRTGIFVSADTSSDTPRLKTPAEVLSRSITYAACFSWSLYQFLFFLNVPLEPAGESEKRLNKETVGLVPWNKHATRVGQKHDYHSPSVPHLRRPPVHHVHALRCRLMTHLHHQIWLEEMSVHIWVYMLTNLVHIWVYMLTTEGSTSTLVDIWPCMQNRKSIVLLIFKSATHMMMYWVNRMK